MRMIAPWGFVCGAVLVLGVGNGRVVEAGSWPQFRGPSSAGRAVGAAKLPAEIGPDGNVVWKAELAPGHSSPAIWGDRIFVTGVDGERLLTIALDRRTGKVLWEAEAPHEK